MRYQHVTSGLSYSSGQVAPYMLLYRLVFSDKH